MFEQALRQMRDKIRARHYVMTLHAEDEMNDDGLTIFDIERGILTGAVLERQIDPESSEFKYVVAGRTIAGDPITVVGKFSPTNKLVIITVYAG
jgi:hypothetical protein